MKRYILLFTLVLPLVVSGQKLSVRLGNKQFEQLNYSKAVEYYEYALKRDSLNSDVIRNLAHAYDKLGKYEKAEKGYQKLVNQETVLAKDWLTYANFLSRRGKYDTAIVWYRKYLDVDSQNEKVKEAMKSTKAKALQILDSFPAKIQNLKINSQYSDFGPAYYKNDLVFSSGRKNSSFFLGKYGWDNQYYLHLYRYSPKSKGAAVQDFAPKMETRFHEGGLCFSADGETMYFTRNSYFDGKVSRSKDGVNNLKIYKAQQVDGKWVMAGEFSYNSDEYSVGHPCLSPDGKTLYFVSDMPGGLGGTDIYRCRRTANGWSQPENLGAPVNTKDREMFPFVSESGHLFFASDGHAGLGGLDLYAVDFTRTPLKVKHLGAPLSSEADDFSIVMSSTGRDGYFASNRKDGVGADDLYAYQLNVNHGAIILIKNSETNELLEADTIRFSAEEMAQLCFNSEQMDYQLKLNRSQYYFLSIEKEGFVVKDTSLHYATLPPVQTHEILLVPEPVEVQPTFQPFSASVYFDFDRYALRSEARDTIVRVAELMREHQDVRLVIEANTDIRGTQSYNQKLAQNRANSALKYLLEQGIVRDRMQVVVLGEEKPLIRKSRQSIKDWHQSNRRVDLKVTLED
ncbi:MAG: OmpA family protein [Marinifilaceae bacterium]